MNFDHLQKHPHRIKHWILLNPGSLYKMSPKVSVYDVATDSFCKCLDPVMFLGTMPLFGEEGAKLVFLQGDRYISTLSYLGGWIHPLECDIV